MEILLIEPAELCLETVSGFVVHCFDSRKNNEEEKVTDPNVCHVSYPGSL